MADVLASSTARPGSTDSTEWSDLARRVLETEAQAILGLIPQLDAAFGRALDLLNESKGRVIVTGMGKSGIIARKLSATLSSTGTSAFFLHPAEAIHGDLGVVRAEDTVIALSYSGETEEIVRLVEAIRRTGARLIALTGHPQSSLGQTSDVTLCCHVAEEACPMNLAPTASTTAALALGDALAMALARRKGFKEEHFANLHPGGRIGKKLMRVEALMQSGDAMPLVAPQTPMKDVLYEISKKGLGMTCVVDAGGRLLGIVTDGDLRRHMERESNLLDRTASEVMTSRPVTIARSLLAVEALRHMEERKITSVVVVNSHNVVEGVVHLHDLWRTQMIYPAPSSMPLSSVEIDARARHLRLLLFDVDGVLSDGSVIIHTGGSEQKHFYIRDGAAIVWAQRAGLLVGLLSGRTSDATVRRAAELRIPIVLQGEADKRAAYEGLLDAHDLRDAEVAYMGDDLLDLPVLARAGLSAAPADAADDVRRTVHWVSRYDGGRGAAREMIELILRAQGHWDAIVASFLSP